MLKEVVWSADRSYVSGSENEPFEFFLQGLCNSNRIDLLLGYFSSAAINLLACGFATFLHNGGRLRLVINHVLSEQDKQAIAAGLQGESQSQLLDLSDIRGVFESLDAYGQHFFDCISWLIAEDRISIVIVKPRGRRGVVHFKSGIFYDQEDAVLFKGSCNFSASAFLENLEQLDAFLSWENSRSSKMIESQRRYFETLFEGNSEDVEYLDISDVEVAVARAFPPKSIHDLLANEKALLDQKHGLTGKRRVKELIKKVTSRIEAIELEPRFPSSTGPRDYQIKAYLDWVGNSRKGIFAMATGTGKTITALNCLLEEYRISGAYRAVILVPTIALQAQWRKECGKFNFQNVITVSSKENWNADISFFSTASGITNASFIVIATYASFTGSKFQSHFFALPADTLFIADELHNLGAPKVSSVLRRCHLERRIGLSATPERQYDEIGNDAIQTFFSDASPYICSYSMQKAIEDKWLCQYKYFPHVVYLNEEELNEYFRISKQLFKYFDTETGMYKKGPEVEFLLLARKRIIHKAANKLSAFGSILKDEFQKRTNLYYTLVYVPEGIEANYEEDDIDDVDIADLPLIDAYTRAVSKTDLSIMVRQFTAGSKDRDQLLKDFEAGKVHVLTSMKCLDEGVDVPRSELAIFCSSTGNPRQFVQRRGRVLRQHKDKHFATIHDLVVVPRAEVVENTFEMEKSLFKKELQRVFDFARLAMNPMDSYLELEIALQQYGLSLSEFEIE